MKEGNIYHIYCDESRQTKDRYMIIGGIMIPQFRVEIVNEKLIQFKNEHFSNNVMKWSEIKNHKEQLYKNWVEFGIDLIDKNSIHFKVVTIDKQQINNKLYNNSSNDKLINKGIYQLVTKKFIFPFYNEFADADIKIIFDKKQTKFPIDNELNTFNNGLKKYNSESNIKITSIESIDEVDSNLLQLVDIFIGGIGYFKNGYLNDTSNKTKGLLSKFICKKMGFNNIKYNSPKSEKSCSVWNINFNN